MLAVFRRVSVMTSERKGSKKMRLFLCLSILIFTGCQQNTDYLHAVPQPPKPAVKVIVPVPSPPPPQHYQHVYKINDSQTAKQEINVDILWVIDNSGSMATYQQSVIDNTNLFIGNFTSKKDLHWKMGLISTSQAEGPYTGFTAADQLNWQTVDPVTQFKTAVGKLGTNGDSTEMTYRPTLNAITSFPDFLRPDAHLALIVLTDEDEQSNYSATPVDTAPFIAQIIALKGGSTSKFITYGVFATTDDCPMGEIPYPTSRYKELMDQTNGTYLKLCATDFGQLLSDLGQDLISKIVTLDPTILLEKRPVPDTIQITYKGNLLIPGPKELGGQYTYDPVYNVINISDPNLLDAKVRDIVVDMDLR